MTKTKWREKKEQRVERRQAKKLRRDVSWACLACPTKEM